MKQIFYLLLGCLSYGFVACSSPQYNDTEEDYDTLFPFGGIDDPETSDNEIVVKAGNPDITKYTFQYRGNEESLGDVEYLVKLTYKFDEYNTTWENVKARYVLRFVNADKQLVSISSNPATNYWPTDEYDKGEAQGAHPKMRPAKTYTQTFKVHSGFELLLCVNGAGPRGSSMVAQIEAQATDGSIPPVVLSSEQYQNAEGMVQLPIPYCKYVILP